MATGGYPADANGARPIGVYFTQPNRVFLALASSPSPCPRQLNADVGERVIGGNTTEATTAAASNEALVRRVSQALVDDRDFDVL